MLNASARNWAPVFSVNLKDLKRPTLKFHNPGFVNFNVGLFKSFKFTEKTGAQFRAEAFNIFNHPNWGGASFNPTNLSSFGKITSKTGDVRNMQLSLRLFF